MVDSLRLGTPDPDHASRATRRVRRLSGIGARTSVRTTAADVLPIHSVRGRTRHRVLTAVLPIHRAWHPLTGPEAPVSVWDLQAVPETDHQRRYAAPAT